MTTDRFRLHLGKEGELRLAVQFNLTQWSILDRTTGRPISSPNMRRAASIHGVREENYSTKGCSARAQASPPMAQFTLAIANSTYRKGLCTEREREEDEAGALHCHTWTHRRGGRRPVARSGSSCRREEGVGSAGSGVGRTVRERIGSVQARAPTEARPRPRRESRSTPWSGLRASACRCSNRPIL
jgi:hypothetical protein